MIEGNFTLIAMKLGQNEGYTKQPLKEEWVGFGIVLKVFRPPKCPGFGAKILKIESKLVSKSEIPPDHRIQTILLYFS